MSNTKDVRMKNSLKILREFLSDKGYTKNEISEKVQLTLVTSSKIINKLESNGVLVEQGIVDSDCGRKASVYSLKPERFYICGLTVELDFYHIEILDLRRTPIFSETKPLDRLAEFSVSMHQICEDIGSAFRQFHIGEEDLLGIGVTVPGIVDSVKGKTVVLPNMPTWNHAPVREHLEKLFQTLVIVEKDNYASILYLKAISEQRLENALLLTILGGIGCGILTGGQLYRGENGLAGEIGHVEFGGGPAGGALLEELASDFAILREITRKKTEAGLPLPEHGEKFNIEAAIEAAKAGDSICKEVFQEAENHLGRALAVLVRLYDPKQIFIDSLWVRELPKTLSNLNNKVKKLNDLLPNCSVKLIVIKEADTIMKGASMLIYDYVINHSTNNKLLG